MSKAREALVEIRKRHQRHFPYDPHLGRRSKSADCTICKGQGWPCYESMYIDKILGSR